jgi:iron complex outermembrane receptor protein
MRDEIAFDAASFTYENIGKSDHTGAEALLRRQWTDWLRTTLSYTWTRAFFRSGDVNGNQINGVPAHRGVIDFDFQLPAAVELGLVLEGNGSQLLDEANTHQLRGYGLVGCRARRAVGRLQAFLQVDNLLNERYAASGYVLPLDGEELLYPATGRSFVLGFDLRR